MMAPEVLTSARTPAESSAPRNHRRPPLIVGATMIGLFGFSLLAGPGDTEIGVFSGSSQSGGAALVVVPEAGSLGGYAPNSVNAPVAAGPPTSRHGSESGVIEPRWTGDDFSMGGFAPNMPPSLRS
jgi:hypothetical protein